MAAASHVCFLLHIATVRSKSVEPGSTLPEKNLAWFPSPGLSYGCRIVYTYVILSRELDLQLRWQNFPSVGTVHSARKIVCQACEGFSSRAVPRFNMPAESSARSIHGSTTYESAGLRKEAAVLRVCQTVPPRGARGSPRDFFFSGLFQGPSRCLSKT